MRTFWEPEPLVWARTEGSHVWDAEGRAYLDLYAGFAVANVGYCHPRVTAAIREQAGVMTHCPSAAPAEIRAELHERLLAIAPPSLDRVLLAVTGAMANETAVQLARAATGRSNVVTFAGTYAGRTVGAVRYAGKHAYREQFGIGADAHFVPYPDPYRSPWAGGGDPGDIVLRLARGRAHRPGFRSGAAGLRPRRTDSGEWRRRDPAGRLPHRPATALRPDRHAPRLRRDPVRFRAQRPHVGVGLRGGRPGSDDGGEGDRRRPGARRGPRPLGADDDLGAGRRRARPSSRTRSTPRQAARRSTCCARKGWWSDLPGSARTPWRV